MLCFELFTMKPDDEHYNAKTTVLIESVLHHVEEEEQEWFPKVREKMGRNELQDLGQRMIDMRPTAPRSPAAPKALKKSLDAVRA
ncbi:hypothetical protein AB0873_19755 [Micromonospora sp. NPDC047707]|uniref:hypothetical protein n=1 Tax=Micromonospora sp. NPDC047707 TaxID=3154498 RepID=UPI0034520D2B